MSEQKEHLFHCASCAEVFRAKIIETSLLKCTHCGEHPVKKKIEELANIPNPNQLPADNPNHGVAGKDAADFVSIQKRNKRRRSYAFLLGWLILLGTVFLFGYKIKSVKKLNEKQPVSSELLSEKLYEERKEKAIVACYDRFRRFTFAQQNTRPEHIYNASEYLIDINSYYENPINNEFYKDSLTRINVIDANLIQQSGRPDCLKLVFEVTSDDKESEYFSKPEYLDAVFWQINDKWLIDWPHFVRLSAISWKQFAQNPNLADTSEFRLFVRQRHVEIDTPDGYTTFVFSQPTNLKSKSPEYPNPVLVKKNSPLENKLLDHISRSLKLSKKNKGLGNIANPPSQSRVRIKIGYEDIKGKKMKVLKELVSTNWNSDLSAEHLTKETEPAK